MQYWECVSRSFRIAWDRKYLWLIALFAGESSGGGGGGSFNTNFGGGRSGGGTAGAPDINAAREAAVTWINDHLGLIIAIGIAWLILAVVFFILGAVCEGATVRASAEHDAERPFGLGLAWRAGVRTMWVIVRFRLLLLLLTLPLLLVVVLLGVGFYFAASNQTGAATGFLALGGLLGLAAIPYLIYLAFLDRFGTRAVILEQLMAIPALGRGHRLLFKRFGRSLLVGLLYIAVSLVLGIVLACLLAIVFVPLTLIGIGIAAASSGNAGVILALFLVALLVFLPIVFVVGGFTSAQASTYWTLAFRRLDLDYAPAPSYQPLPPPAPPAPPAPYQPFS